MRHAVLGIAIVLAAGTLPARAQQSAAIARDLIGTWTLVSVQQGVDGEKPTTVPNPRGLLVLDGGGHVFETVTRGAGRGAGAAPAGDPAATLATFSGFWGAYTADAAARKMTLRPRGAVNPNVMDTEFSRTYELRGDLLTVTAPAGEPQTRVATRWMWERVPNVENLSAGYRQVIGFWEHVSEGALNLTTGATSTELTRAPSVIVYTPAGYVGVHFPPRNRPRFAGAEPTPEEARAALAGYIGYFGALGVYPGMVFHQILAGISPAQGSTLKRTYELKGNELMVRFRPLASQPGSENGTYVRLRRLSGEKEMLR